MPVPCISTFIKRSIFSKEKNFTHYTYVYILLIFKKKPSVKNIVFNLVEDWAERGLI